MLVALEQTAMKFNAELLSSLCTDLIAMKMLAKQNLGNNKKYWKMKNSSADQDKLLKTL